MAPTTYLKYFYLPDYCSEEESLLIIQSFEAVGYNSGNVRRGESIDHAVEQLARGDVLVIYTFEEFSSVAELSDLLIRMEERGVLLQSLREPWVNETIRDHASSVGKIRCMISRVTK